MQDGDIRDLSSREQTFSDAILAKENDFDLLTI